MPTQDPSFSGIKVPYSHPEVQMGDFAQCLIHTGIPATVAAAGTGQSTAATSTDSRQKTVVVTGADGTKGYVLPTPVGVGETRIVVNQSVTQGLWVYPQSGAAINNNSTNAAVFIGAGDSAMFTYIATNLWQRLATSQETYYVTSTAAGTGTGVIPTGGFDAFVQVTSASSANVVTLPAPIPGAYLTITCSANGYKLQSNAPSTVAINGGTGATAKTSVAAGVTLNAFCSSATTWQIVALAANGTPSAQAAAA